jgi:hypothetical protein
MKYNLERSIISCLRNMVKNYEYDTTCCGRWPKGACKRCKDIIRARELLVKYDTGK